MKEYLVVEYPKGWKSPDEPLYYKVTDMVHPTTHVSYKHTIWYWLGKARDDKASISIYQIGECILDWS